MKKWILFFIAIWFSIVGHAAPSLQNGASPILEITPDSTSTIALIAGDVTTRQYTVTNKASISVENLIITPSFEINSAVATATVSANTCTGTLVSNASCTFTVTITAQNKAGTEKLQPRVCIKQGINCSIPTLPNRVSLTVKTLQSIAVTPASPTITAAQQLTATGTYSDSSTADITASVTWASSATSIATIGASTGLVTPVSVGTTNITATSGSVVSPNDLVTVGARVLSSIAVTPASPGIRVGSTQQFTATGTYSYGSTQDITSSVTWASSATGIATITSSGGLATGVADGSTNVTATLGSVTSSSVELQVGLQSIAITPASPTITAAQQFTATGTYADGTTENITSGVTWASSSTGVATIGSSTGLATPVSAGTTNITATSGSVVSPSNTVTVGAPVLSSIAITPTSATIASGATQQFTATGTYSYGATQDITSSVTWNSSSTSVATIGASTGLATGVAAGSSNITATLSSVTSNTASLTVTESILIAAGYFGSNAVLLKRNSSTGVWEQFTNTAISGYTSNVGTDYGLSDCTGSLCVVVGRKNTNTSALAVLVQTTNGGSAWTQFTVTGVAGSNDHFNGGVSCTGSGASAICIAAGTKLVKTVDGGSTWSLQSVTGALGNYYGVNCKGSGSTAICLAAGGDASTPVLAQSTNGGVTWSKVSIPAIDASSGVLYGVSCNDDNTLCVAVGRTGADNNSGSPVLVQTVNNGATWSVVSVTGAPSTGYFLKVSCTGSGSNTRCAVIGEDMSGFYVPVVAQTSGISGSWSTTTVSGAAANVNLRAVSCAGSGSSSTCVAVGQDFASHFGPAAFQTVNGGGAWSNITSPNPPFTGGAGLFLSVKCIDASGTATCEAPGENDATPHQMLFGMSVGGVWSSATTSPATISSTSLY